MSRDEKAPVPSLEMRVGVHLHTITSAENWEISQHLSSRGTARPGTRVLTARVLSRVFYRATSLGYHPWELHADLPLGSASGAMEETWRACAAHPGTAENPECTRRLHRSPPPVPQSTGTALRQNKSSMQVIDGASDQ